MTTQQEKITWLEYAYRHKLRTRKAKRTINQLLQGTEFNELTRNQRSTVAWCKAELRIESMRFKRDLTHAINEGDATSEEGIFAPVKLTPQGLQNFKQLVRKYNDK